MKSLVPIRWLLSMSLLAGILRSGLAADSPGWRAFYTVEGVANAARLTQDAQGNIYAGGTVWLGDAGWGVSVVKYSPDGRQLWAHVFDADLPAAPRADDGFSQTRFCHGEVRRNRLTDLARLGGLGGMFQTRSCIPMRP